MKPGATLVLGETDPDLVPSLRARVSPGEILLRDRDFAVRSQRLAHGGRLVDLFDADAAVRRRVPPAARRAPGRQRGDRARRGGELPRRAHRRRRRRRRRSRRCVRRAGSRSSAANRCCCSTARTTSRVRAALRPRSTRSSRPARARSSSVARARRSRTRCSRRSGSRRRRRRRACAAEPAALDPMVVANAAMDLGFDNDADRRHRLASPRRGGREPLDGDAGRRPGDRAPARSTPSARPGRCSCQAA